MDKAPAVLDPLREYNRQRVLDHLSRQGALSRAELARLTGLSRTTISSIVGDLRDAGLVDQTEVEDSGRKARGRPAGLLTLAPPSGFAAAIDFGQRHLRVAVAELTPTVLAEHWQPFDTSRSGDDALDAAAAVLDDVLIQAGLMKSQLSRVVLGVPGPLNPSTGTVLSGVILPGWTRIDPAEGLRRRIGLPVTAENDANLGALGEATFGAGKSVRDVLYVKISTGLGAGLVLGGRLHRGATGIAGEIGHVQVVPDGDTCRCGNIGCLETVVSAPRILAGLQRVGGRSMTLAELRARVAAGDAGAVRALYDAGRQIGRALAPLCNVLNPSAVITGGTIGGSGHPLVEGIRSAIDQYAQPGAAAALTVQAGSLGDRAEVLGGLALAAAEEGHLLRPLSLSDA